MEIQTAQFLVARIHRRVTITMRQIQMMVLVHLQRKTLIVMETRTATVDCNGDCAGTAEDLGCGCNEPAAAANADCDGNCLEGYAQVSETDYSLSNASGGCTDGSYTGSYPAGYVPNGAYGTDGVNYLYCGSGGCFLQCLGVTTTSCELAGCTDSTACNFNADAMVDDASCTYAEANFDCDGNCIVDIDCAGVCGGETTVDECGECGGAGIAEGACDCDGNVDLGCGCGEPAGLMVSCEGGSWQSEVFGQ